MSYGEYRPPRGEPVVQLHIGENAPQQYNVESRGWQRPSDWLHKEQAGVHRHGPIYLANIIDVGIFKDTIAPSFALHSGLAVIAWGVGRHYDRLEAKDWLWPSGQVINAWWSAVGKRTLVDGYPLSMVLKTISWPERLLLTGVTVWGTRSFYRIASKSLKRGKDDPRYSTVKKADGFWNTVGPVKPAEIPVLTACAGIDHALFTRGFVPHHRHTSIHCPVSAPRGSDERLSPRSSITFCWPLLRWSGARGACRLPARQAAARKAIRVAQGGCLEHCSSSKVSAEKSCAVVLQLNVAQLSWRCPHARLYSATPIRQRHACSHRALGSNRKLRLPPLCGWRCCKRGQRSRPLRGGEPFEEGNPCAFEVREERFLASTRGDSKSMDLGSPWCRCGWYFA